MESHCTWRRTFQRIDWPAQMDFCLQTMWWMIQSHVNWDVEQMVLQLWDSRVEQAYYWAKSMKTPPKYVLSMSAVQRQRQSVPLIQRGRRQGIWSWLFEVDFGKGDCERWYWVSDLWLFMNGVCQIKRAVWDLIKISFAHSIQNKNSRSFFKTNSPNTTLWKGRILSYLLM